MSRTSDDLGLFACAVLFLAFTILAIASVGVGIGVYLYHHPRPQPTSEARNNTRPSVPAASKDLLLGNPSGATSDETNRNNFLMVKQYYALSYNDSKGTPNWVSWELTGADLGDAPRKPTFSTDTTLPIGFHRVVHRDYSASGFDRGHMCPHGDRTATLEMSYATFIMTNVIPQAPRVNRGGWEEVEDYCRTQARAHQHLYIISGPLGVGGTGSAGPASAIGNNTVTVPAECWKVVVMVPDSGDDDLAKINAQTRVLTVDMPNDENSISGDWAQYRTSPAEVERKTGYHFFDRVPPDVATVLRQRVDANPLPPPHHRNYEAE